MEMERGIEWWKGMERGGKEWRGMKGVIEKFCEVLSGGGLSEECRRFVVVLRVYSLFSHVKFQLNIRMYLR